jgi:hypothetical protein
VWFSRQRVLEFDDFFPNVISADREETSPAAHMFLKVVRVIHMWARATFFFWFRINWLESKWRG